ncbi:MAG: hypothetical protein R6U91_05460 [Bacillota bacterium]
MAVENNWVFLTEVSNDVEADIICGFLWEKGIPARKSDSSPYTGAMRVIGGQALEVQVLVPEPYLNQAENLLHEFESSFEWDPEDFEE